MADNTSIEWADATWNPITGCSVVSPGCTNCYAMRHAARMERMLPPNSHYAGLTKPSKGGPVWTGQVNLAPDHIMTKPLRWRKPKRIFVNSMSDLVHEAVPDEWIDRVFAVMAMAPQHTFQVLTKRPERMREYCIDPNTPHRIAKAMDTITASASHLTAERNIGGGHQWAVEAPIQWPLPNCWKGVSVEDQARADERIPILLDTPAAVRWISAEPLLGGINIGKWIGDAICGSTYVAAGKNFERCDLTGAPCAGIDWIVAGSESGPGARPCDIEWIRSLRDQCAAAEVPFFWKQHVENGRKIGLPMLDGVTHDAFPEVTR
jgi:protein gp37